MYEAKVNDSFEFKVEEKPEGIFLNGELHHTDIVKISAHAFQVLYKGQSIKVFVEEVDTEEKVVRLRINGKKAHTQLTSELDRLLKDLGMEDLATVKAADIKAPMPGLIHSLLVDEGAEVQKGDGILILEAMKMENVIKAPADGVIGKILVDQGASVEKNALLVSLA